MQHLARNGMISLAIRRPSPCVSPQTTDLLLNEQVALRVDEANNYSKAIQDSKEWESLAPTGCYDTFAALNLIQLER